MRSVVSCVILKYNLCLLRSALNPKGLRNWWNTSKMKTTILISWWVYITESFLCPLECLLNWHALTTTDVISHHHSLFVTQVACMQFINIVVHSVEDMNFRVHLQYDFTKLALDDYLEVRNCSKYILFTLTQKLMSAVSGVCFCA